MKIAIDYDGTYTLNPELFQDFIISMWGYGYEPFIVTMRDEDRDVIKDQWLTENHDGIKIIYCNGYPKKTVCDQLGLKFDIWIDDTPESIHLGSSFTEAQLEKWRANERTD